MVLDHNLGNVSAVSGPTVVLAPLSGVSDVVFRRIARRWGADRVVTEMVAAEDLVRGGEEARLRAAGLGVNPHVVQLVGREPSGMAEAARLAEASGADVVDINMGCPAKRVTGGLAGSALMREADVASRIIEAVVGAVGIPVTVKMRLGWDDASRNAAELGCRAVSLGVAGLTVHGRTRQQFYTGRADWPAIGQIVDALAIPVVANGDVVDTMSARSCLAQSRAAGLMVGRAAVGQPWLVGAIGAALQGHRRPGPTCAERAALACEHYEGLLGLYGREVGRRHARKHLAAYADRAQADGYEVRDAVRRELVTSDDTARVLDLLSRLFVERVSAAA